MGSRFGIWPNEICSIRELRALANFELSMRFMLKLWSKRTAGRAAASSS